MGASSGGMSALRRICGTFSGDLPAAVFIVWHTSPNAPGYLPIALNRDSKLPASIAQHGEPIKQGRIYVAPPDHHLLLSAEGIELNRGPRENRFRPAIDPLFRTAARTFGRRVIGVILTGRLDDGTNGLLHVKRHGGLAVVQDPKTAEEPSMCESALEFAGADFVLPLDHIGPKLVELTRKNVAQQEVTSPMQDRIELGQGLHPEQVTSPPIELSCPDCNGAVWKTDENGKSIYTCHVGHRFTEEGFVAAKNEELEIAIWTANRVPREGQDVPQHAPKGRRQRQNQGGGAGAGRTDSG